MTEVQTPFGIFLPDWSDPQNQDILLDLRAEKLTSSFQEIYAGMKKWGEAFGEKEYVQVEALRSLHFEKVPENTHRLLEIAGAPEETFFEFSFEHYKCYMEFKPSYSLGVRWNRPPIGTTVIHSLRFNIPETEARPVINEFIVQDFKYAFRSDWHFPYPLDIDPGYIPDADVAPMNRYRDMHKLVYDKPFQIKLLEEFAELFSAPAAIS